MKPGTLYSKKSYKRYSKLYLITSIFFILFGIISTFALPPFGIIVIIVGVILFLFSKRFKNNSINGGFSEEIENFKATYEVDDFIKFNDNTKLLLISPKFNPQLITYDSILDYELLENGNTVINKSGVGRALVGGVLFGGIGAIVGGVTGKKTITSKIKSIKIKIVTKNNKIYFINLLNIEVKNTSMIYKVAYENAQKILSKLDMINTFYSDESPTNLSVADELSKLNSLLKEGILTQEEFESQKNKLLNK